MSVPDAAPIELSFGDSRSELQPGDRLGNWTLRSELGSGGMGRVFLAERSDGHYRQRAAIKLLLGWNSEEGLEQLARERQILADLSHPSIARLIDGGTTPLGRPYLVMDYVEGVPVHEHVRAKRLGLAAVLALFDQVLQAVAAAHRQLVVHCDLKPGNVLVTPEGHAMLLDFGIARLHGSNAETLHDVVTWTPRYASPEQQRGAKPGIPSDIYSLGRMLEDLLALVQPRPGREKEWRAIVARATATDPERRYPTAVSMGEDLHRFTRHRPLAALPHTPRYVVAKLLRRRWPWATAGAAAVVATVAFTLQLMHQRDRARAAEQMALTEAATTRAVSDFVVSLFEGADPAVSGRKDMPASELVERGRERIETELPGQPALQAAMKAVLAQVYGNVGRPRVAEELYEQAAALERHGAVARPLREAAVLSRQAVLISNGSQPGRALEPAQRALALAEANAAADSLEVADALNTLGIVLTGNGRFAEAESALARALEIRMRRAGPDTIEVAAVHHNLGLVHRAAGRLDDAERELRRSLAIKRGRWPEGSPQVLISLESLGTVLGRQRKLDDAEQLFRTALAQRRALYGDDNIKVSWTINELANVLHDSGRIDDAVAAYREALRINEGVLGDGAMDTAIAVNNLASAHEDAGDTAAAEAGLRRSLAMREKLLQPADLGLARGRHNLGRFLLRQGRLAEARPLIATAREARAARLPAGHRERVDSALLQAELEVAAGQLAAAAAALAEVQPHEPSLSPLRRAALERARALLAIRQGKRADALARHEQALKLAASELRSGHPGLQLYTIDLAEAAHALGGHERAHALVRPLMPALQRHAADSALRRRAQALLSGRGVG